jgi:hypothetical protein
MDESSFETPPDAHSWRLARRETALAERERQAVLRERELASRDAARQRAETALADETQRAAELAAEVEVLRARVIELETAPAAKVSSHQVHSDREETSRTAPTREERRRLGLLPIGDRQSGGKREQVAPSANGGSAWSERWMPIDARPSSRRRA